MDFLQPLKNIYHFFQAHLWRLVYGRPDVGLRVYGVTGTNGKTTTSFILASILDRAFGAREVGMFTTVALRSGVDMKLNASKMTTLSSRQVYRALRDMKRKGVRHVVLEMTSHALAQWRLAGLSLQGALFTNIAREHLDYHRTMERYAKSKQKILDYVVAGGVVVGKEEGVWLPRILELGRRRGFSVHSFTPIEASSVATPLLGYVNKENVLAAQLFARALGLSSKAIAEGVRAVTHVSGRMEWLDGPGGVRVLIDYAVTPDALKALCSFVRPATSGKIFAVLGAAGLRDRGKRPAMTRAVAQFADEIVITREDPWTEPEEQIFNDLEAGLRGSSVTWRRIADRRQALEYALKKAVFGDVVVVTGKGAEMGMAIGTQIVPWSEREVIAEIFARL
jgi:UDP-N-acetylmuramoyl-L-alanyl-D-glutamate--2,6-diaminopimelate ligase